MVNIKNKDYSLKSAKKDKDWFEHYLHVYAPFNENLDKDHKREISNLYDFFNSDLSAYQSELNEMCDNTIDFESEYFDVQPFNKIKNKFEILAGDYLTTANNHKIMLLTAKAVKHKDTQFLEAIGSSVEKELAAVMEQNIETLMNLSSKELEEFITKERGSIAPKDLQFKNYLSDLEIYKNKMLQYTMIDQEVDTKKYDAYKDLFITDSVFLYNGWKYGRPYFKVCNPLNCEYHLSSNIAEVHKGDYFCYTDDVTITELFDEYYKVQNNKDLEEFLKLIETGSHITDPNRMYHHDKYHYPNLDLGLINSVKQLASKKGLNYRDLNAYGNTLFNRTHLEFKAYKKVIFYKSFDEVGTPTTVVLENNSNIIPSDANKLKFKNKWQEDDYKYVWSVNGLKREAEICYIPRRYEIEAINNNSIITKHREVPFQPVYVNKPHLNFELSYKGGVMNARNAKSLSLMKSVMPIQKQIIVAKALQNREFSKYRGFEIIQDAAQMVDNLGANNKGEEDSLDPISENEKNAKITGTRFINSSLNNGYNSPTRGSGVQAIQLGQSVEIMNLQQLIDLLDAEMGIAMGVPKPREGQVTANSNVTDNQQSIRQTSLHSQIYAFWLNKHFNSTLNEHLSNLDTYYKNWFKDNPNSKEHLLEYITRDGTKELVKILPEYLDMEDTGLFLINGVNNNMYMNIMYEKIAQNTFDPATLESISTVLKSLSNGASSEDLHREIQLLSSKIKEDQQVQLKQQEEAAMKQYEMAQQLELEKHKLELEKIKVKENARGENELLKAQLESRSIANAYDIDQNKKNDLVQSKEIEVKSKEKINREKIKADKEIVEMEGKIKKEIERLKNKGN